LELYIAYGYFPILNIIMFVESFLHCKIHW
jgi:hypothetical protein